MINSRYYLDLALVFSMLGFSICCSAQDVTQAINACDFSKQSFYVLALDYKIPVPAKYFVAGSAPRYGAAVTLISPIPELGGTQCANSADAGRVFLGHYKDLAASDFYLNRWDKGPEGQADGVYFRSVSKKFSSNTQFYYTLIHDQSDFILVIDQDESVGDNILKSVLDAADTAGNESPEDKLIKIKNRLAVLKAFAPDQ